MNAIYPGRYTAHVEEPLTLFLIGMRIHKPLRIRTWWPAFSAMSRMLQQLQSDPGLGLLAATFAYTPHPLIIQYWRSLDHLHRFARDPALSHRPAWKTFNQLTTTSTDVVGLWHEAYVVTPHQTQSLYRDMPRTGLALATELSPSAGPHRQVHPSPPGKLAGRAGDQHEFPSPPTHAYR